jgi:response regulator RpfG family c-di-GMP phosphodiesterase
MPLFKDTGGDPRELVATILALYGALGDAACGNPRGFAARKAGAAVAFAKAAGVDAGTRDALAFAATLHAVGAIGNAQAGDAPVLAARRCAQIAALPSATAELVRAQAEHWDGTGFPDQLRWDAVPFPAQFLLLAEIVLRSAGEDEALERVNAESGRALAPPVAAAYDAWTLHGGGAIAPVVLPYEALDAGACDPGALFELVAVTVARAVGAA